MDKRSDSGHQLDGLNIWYEARLIEEGIEDMQNLATANLVDVILYVPPHQPEPANVLIGFAPELSPAPG